MIRLVSKDICTGCGACAFKCPHACISMQEDNMGGVFPHLDTTNCIECHACEKVCPIQNAVQGYEPQRAYAAWSNDEEERRTSASGGVAIEIYKYCLQKGYKAIGASQNEDFSVTHKVAYTNQELIPFKNSKYVFSEAFDVFPQIRELLKADEKLIFIGLPCQVAALRKLFNDHENLLLIEVVCHGITPLSFLRQHINFIESCEKQKAKNMSFRDPDTQTYTFTFTLYNENNERFYAKRTKDGDTYQYGYHRSISYRENCYNCHFARKQRVSDITLSDYKGLGKMAPCDYTQRKVSSLLCNTAKGTAFIDEFLKSNKIHADIRPTEEPIAGDPRLRMSTIKSKARLDFERAIQMNNGDFESTMREVIIKDTRRKHIQKLIKFPKKILRKLLERF